MPSGATSRHNDARGDSSNAIPASRLHGHHDRPSMVSVGTIIWLSSELMFFAALFAAYFTIRAVSPELWAAEHRAAQRPVRLGQHHDPGAVVAHLPARRLRRRARPGRPHRVGAQRRRLGPARVVHPHLRHGRGLHRRPGDRVRRAGPRGRHHPGLGLRHDVLPHHRLPRPPRDRRPDRLPASSSAAPTSPASSPTSRPSARSSCPTTGTSSTWSGSACSPPSTSSSNRPPTGLARTRCASPEPLRRSPLPAPPRPARRPRGAAARACCSPAASTPRSRPPRPARRESDEELVAAGPRALPGRLLVLPRPERRGRPDRATATSSARRWSASAPPRSTSRSAPAGCRWPQPGAAGAAQAGRLRRGGDRRAGGVRRLASAPARRSPTRPTTASRACPTRSARRRSSAAARSS